MIVKFMCMLGGSAGKNEKKRSNTGENTLEQKNVDMIAANGCQASGAKLYIHSSTVQTGPAERQGLYAPCVISSSIASRTYSRIPASGCPTSGPRARLLKIS